MLQRRLLEIQIKEKESINKKSQQSKLAACKNQELHAFQRPLGRISDILSEDTLGLTIF